MSVAFNGSERFVQLMILIVEEGAKALRKIWKREWNSQTGHVWDDSLAHYHGIKNCGTYFYDLEMAAKPKSKLILNPTLINKITSGNSEDWDVSLLTMLLTYSAIIDCTMMNVKERNAIHIIRSERNINFGHIAGPTISESDFLVSSPKVVAALRDLGVDITVCNAILTRRCTDISMEEIIAREIASSEAAVAELKRDPRIRLNEWLDNNFIGSNRRKLKPVHADSETSDTNNSLTLIDCKIPTLSIQVSPEDVIIPLITDETKLVVGGRAAIENTLGTDAMEPERIAERWILALDDKRLSAENFTVFFDKTLNKWRISVPNSSLISGSAVHAEVYVTTLADPNIKSLVEYGSSTVLWRGCKILCGKHKLRILELTTIPVPVKAEKTTEQQKLLSWFRDCKIISFLPQDKTVSLHPEYIPHGRLNGLEGNYDVLDRYDNNASGGFGKLHKVQHAVTKTIYALKCPKYLDEQRIRNIETELRIFLALELHPHIIPIVDFLVSSNVPHIIMEYAEYGSLDTWLVVNNKSTLYPRIMTDDNHNILSPSHIVARIVDMLVQITDALGFAHNDGFCHGDIKPGNILVCSLNTSSGLYLLNVKLCDFGGAGFFDADERSDGNAVNMMHLQIDNKTPGYGTNKYQSPEQRERDISVLTNKTDVFSFGVLVNTIIATVVNSDVTNNLTIVESNLVDHLLGQTSFVRQNLISDMLQLCVSINYQQRPTMYEIRSILISFCNANQYNYDAPLFIILRRFVDMRRAFDNSYRDYYWDKADRFMLHFYTAFCRDYESADKLHKNILANRNNHPGDLANYAEFLDTHMKDYVQAERYYELALVEQPNSVNLLYNYALYWMSAKSDNIKAEIYFRRILSIDSNHLLSISTLAVILEGKREFIEAESLYLRAIKIDSNSPVRCYNYARFLEEYKGEYNKAEKYYLKALAIKNNHVMSMFAYADMLQTMKQYDKSIMMYKQLLSVDPNHTSAMLNLAQLYQVMGQNSDLAMNLYKHCIAIEPNNILCLHNYGHLAYENNDMTLSESLYKRAITVDPQYAPAWCGLGQCYYRLAKNVEKAEKAYKMAIKCDPNWVAGLFQYGRMLAENGFYQEALVHIERADVLSQHSEPSITQTLTEMRKIMSTLGVPKLSNLSTTNATLLLQAKEHKDQGNILTKSKDYESAIKMYLQALIVIKKQNPATTESNALKVVLYNNIAHCHIQRNNWDQVIINCTKALETDSTSHKAFYRRALAHEAKSNYVSALADILQALKHCDNNPVAVKEIQQVKARIEMHV